MAGLPIVLLLMLFLVAIVLAAIVIVASARTRRRVSSPSCGSCGYAVEGLEILRCPECGSDLRSVGIVTPQMTRGIRAGVAATIFALAWTLALPLPAAIANLLAYNAIPKRYDNTLTLTLGAGRPSTLPDATITCLGSGPRPNAAYETARVRLTFPDGTESLPLVVDIAGGVCNTIDPATMLDEPERMLSPATVLDWMVASGADPDRLLSQRQADELYQNVVQFPTTRTANSSGRVFNSVSSSSSSALVRNKWFGPISGTAIILVWIGGILFILRRYRRQKRARPGSAA